MIYQQLEIDAEQGRVYWISAPGNRIDLVGEEAGGLHPDGKGKPYWTIEINGECLRRARLVFLAAHGRWPEPFVDHINGDTLDDRAANLREATALQNSWNKRVAPSLAGLPRGVRIQRNGRFQAQIQWMRKKIAIGTFDTAEQAGQAYEAKRRELFGEWA